MIGKRLSLTLTTVALAAFASGCTGQGDAPMETPGGGEHAAHGGEHAAHGEGGHEHAHGPHGGHVYDLGDHEYLAELTHSHETGKVTIYVYEHEGQTPKPISAKEVTINVMHGGQPEQFTLAASPVESDPEGKSSRFTITDEELAGHLHEEGTEPKLNAMIEGKQYSASLAAHGDHAGHDHGHEGHAHEGEGHKHAE